MELLPPPEYNSFNFNNIQAQSLARFNLYMTELYEKINVFIKKSVDRGLFKCKIYLNLKNVDKFQLGLVKNAIKKHYSLEKLNVKISKFEKNIYKLKIKW